MRVSPARLGFLLLVPVLVHCKTAPPTEGASASASATAPSATSTTPELPPFVIPTAAPVAVPEQVKLLSNGDSPRRELRYKYKGAKESDLVMELGMTVQMGMGGVAPGNPIVLPTTRITLHMTPKSVSDAGDLSYDFEIKGIDVAGDSKASPPVIAAMKNAMEKIQGTRGSGVSTNVGESKSVAVSLPPEGAPQVRELMDRMKQQLGDVAVRLPAEAVGKGAQWERTSGFIANGLMVEQTAKYTLVSLDGDVMKLSIAITQKAQQQEIKASGLPKGAKVYLETFEATGAGESTRDLGKLVGKSTSHVASKAHSRVSQGGKDGPMTMNVEMSTTVSPK